MVLHIKPKTQENIIPEEHLHPEEKNDMESWECHQSLQMLHVLEILIIIINHIWNAPKKSQSLVLVESKD